MCILDLFLDNDVYFPNMSLESIVLTLGSSLIDDQVFSNSLDWHTCIVTRPLPTDVKDAQIKECSIMPY